MDLGIELEKASKSKFRLWLLNRILWRVVPFNKPHKLILTRVRPDSISILLPYKKTNLNHIKGVHACALATLSEYITGLSLLRVLNSKEYRLIMKSLKMDYFYQGKKDVIATFELNKTELTNKLNTAFETNESLLVPLSVDIFDVEKNHICSGNVDWHIKPWKNVKTEI